MGWVANGVPTDTASTIPNPLVVAQSSPDMALRPQSRWGPGCGQGGTSAPTLEHRGQGFGWGPRSVSPPVGSCCDPIR